MAKRLTYQIWQSVDSGESGMHTTDRSQKEQDFLSRDTNGKKMLLMKEFQTAYPSYARKVYNKFFGFK